MSQLVQDRRRTALVATHVSATQRERLLDLARKEDRSLSSILRRAIDRELERHEEGR